MRFLRLLFGPRHTDSNRGVLASVQHRFQCLPVLSSFFKPYLDAHPYRIMDVPNSRFPYEVLKIIQEVSECHFIAFDLEFSGIAGRRPEKSGKLTLQQVYQDTKAAAEKYQILQVGFTIVKEDLKEGCYVARPYNFNLSPLTPLPERFFGRVWSYHSGGQYHQSTHRDGTNINSNWLPRQEWLQV